MNKEDNVDKRNKAINNLIEAFNKSDIENKDISYVISNFIYSIGASMSEKKYNNNEEVLKDYALKPTFSRALMAQAVFMKETWNTETENLND